MQNQVTVEFGEESTIVLLPKSEDEPMSFEEAVVKAFAQKPDWGGIPEEWDFYATDGDGEELTVLPHFGVEDGDVITVIVLPEG